MPRAHCLGNLLRTTPTGIDGLQYITQGIYGACRFGFKRNNVERGSDIGYRSDEGYSIPGKDQACRLFGLI